MRSFSYHLERWRNESETRRQRRALFLASGLTLSLFILWLAGFRLAASLRETPMVAATASVGVVIPSPAPGIIARIKAGWRAITP